MLLLPLSLIHLVAESTAGDGSGEFDVGVGGCSGRQRLTEGAREGCRVGRREKGRERGGSRQTETETDNKKI